MHYFASLLEWLSSPQSWRLTNEWQGKACLLLMLIFLHRSKALSPPPPPLSLVIFYALSLQLLDGFILQLNFTAKLWIDGNLKSWHRPVRVRTRNLFWHFPSKSEVWRCHGWLNFLPQTDKKRERTVRLAIHLHHDATPRCSPWHGWRLVLGDNKWSCSKKMVTALN